MPVNRCYRHPRCPWGLSSHEGSSYADKRSDKPRLEGDSFLDRDAATTDSDKGPGGTDNWRRCAAVALGHRKLRRCRTSASVTMHRIIRAALQNLTYTQNVNQHFARAISSGSIFNNGNYELKYLSIFVLLWSLTLSWFNVKIIHARRKVFTFKWN